jgi:hypothetical protein
MKPETVRLLALGVIAFCLILLVGMGWKLSEIVADLTPPTIQEVLEGSIPAPPDGRVRLYAVALDNVGIQSVSCEIHYLGKKQETATLKPVGDNRYEGSTGKTYFSGSVLTLKYKAVDYAGHITTKTATLTLLGSVDIDGHVTVNGEKVEGQNDVIYVRTLSLDIRVYITKGVDFVKAVKGSVEGQQLSFTKKTGYGGHPYWQASYTLPDEGRYSFTVKVTDKYGESFLLASWSVSYGVEGLPRDRLLLALGALAVLGGAAVYGYYGRRGGEGAGSGRRS